ncbi:MAG: 2-C-methyl-D-erythritol 2,4-cyclodiphosphate synthase [Gemmatimonadetes bacterium]|nr:2-C-methyl-D-erythritol 2,4-cyclodiphosphate synthase [Gemmatimonadota bacterium]MBT8402918.1 2-C-methyl-D-erythritol 2,4-cyclodiphosphate synthase [Gemmatimonadota bacterium]NNK63725.1 2-C-methyl-D-erythritol 2,4-cyclodiphosphate synthase [Gemmatimonadota bacterium]
MRVGFGYDSHRFDSARPLVLGGVVFPDHPGLTGHSDADAVCHAITDAILGAAALGDIGRHFPPSDDRWKGADSIDLLERAVALLAGQGDRVVNVDVTVICQTPKIGPRVDEMRGRLAGALRVDTDFVSVKGKTNEQLGWIGRSEGIGVHAVALIERSSTSRPARETPPAAP